MQGISAHCTLACCWFLAVALVQQGPGSRGLATVPNKMLRSRSGRAQSGLTDRYGQQYAHQHTYRPVLSNICSFASLTYHGVCMVRARMQPHEHHCSVPVFQVGRRSWNLTKVTSVQYSMRDARHISPLHISLLLVPCRGPCSTRTGQQGVGHGAK